MTSFNWSFAPFVDEHNDTVWQGEAWFNGAGFGYPAFPASIDDVDAVAPLYSGMNLFQSRASAMYLAPPLLMDGTLRRQVVLRRLPGERARKVAENVGRLRAAA